MFNKKETIVDFKQFLGQKVTIKLLGERAVSGSLKSVDGYLNLILEDSEEKIHNKSRFLGTIVLKGSMINYLSPCRNENEYIEIENPFG
jgi:small nuclear ribonucleoprotein (snRNP)-like protein